MERSSDAPRIVCGSPLPYVLGTREETIAVVKGECSFYDHVRREWGDVSDRAGFTPLLMGARLVHSRAHFLVEEGAAPKDVRAYVDDNFGLLAQLGDIADESDLDLALSYLHNCLSQGYGNKVERPHVQVDLRFKEGSGSELYGISVHAPPGYSFSPLTAAAVLHEAIGSSAGRGLRNEFLYAPQRMPLPFTVLQYDPGEGERRYKGRLRLRITEQSVETRDKSSVIVIDRPKESLDSGVRRLDKILKAA